MSLNELLCFVEDTFQCVLKAHGLDWHPVALNGYVQRFFTPAIGSTLLETKKYCIGHPSPAHLKYVVKLMSSSPGGCQNYIFLVGQHYFKGKVFTWHDFRVFLAFLGEVAVYTFREEGILLIDDIVLNTTLYVKDYLQYWIDQLGGWTAFQLDCVRNVLHLTLSLNTQVFYEGPVPSAPSEQPCDPLLSNEHPIGMSSPPPKPPPRRPPVLMNMSGPAIQVLPSNYVPRNNLRPVFSTFSAEEPA